MSKFEKKSLIVAAIAAGLGIILLVLGVLFGGIAILRDGNALKTISQSIPFIHFSEYELNQFHERMNADDDAMDDTPGTLGAKEYTFAVDSVKNIDLNVSAYEVVVKPSDNDQVKITTNGRVPLLVVEKGNTLKIESKSEKAPLSAMNRDIELWIPEDAEFESIDWKIGAGEFDCVKTPIICKKFSLSIGAGEVDLEGLSAENAKINVGAGSLSMRDTKIGEAIISVDMGECNIDGDVTGNLNLNVNMGEANLRLGQDVSAHNYEISVTAGEINIDDQSLAGLNTKRSIDNGADSTYIISCNMGEVNVKN